MHPTSTAFDVEAAVLTDVGRHRETNQDAASFVRPHDPAVVAAKGVLLVVADGMGGHSGGEVASRIAVEAVRRAYYENGAEPAEALAHAVARANGEIYEAARQNPRLAGMGTTCTALAIRADGAACAHVGDSRIYLVRRGRIYAMTADHSSVQQMVDLGLLTPDQARHHADKNVLLRAVGTHPEVEVATWNDLFPVEPGDRFVVCSDGLYTLVEDTEIEALVLAQRPATACRRLVQLALDRGGYDNITVAVLEVSPPAATPGRSVRDTRDLSDRQARDAAGEAHPSTASHEASIEPSMAGRVFSDRRHTTHDIRSESL